MEEWRDIKGFEGQYQVSNYGRVRSLNYMHTGETRELKVRICRGYSIVHLRRKSVSKYCKVHRLVCEAFIPNPDGLPCVNHKDEDKTNNRADNLEWCTVKYNTNYGTGIERTRVKNINHPSKSKRVYQYTLSGEFVRSYPSQMEAQRQTGILVGNISAAAHGTYGRKSTGNYIWSYDPPAPTTNRALF